MPDVDVLVVGGGPTGLMAALLLEQLGVETRIVEQRDGPLRPPAAHAVNARTLEICRSAGVDMATVAQAAADPAEAAYVYWVTRLGGRVLGRLRYEQQGDDQLAVTPTPLRNLSQSRFEPILVETLRRETGSAPEWQTRWLSCVEEEDQVRTTLLDLASGCEREITSRFVIAADGAGSRIRKSLGIDVAGPARLQSFVMVHFRACLRGVPEVPPGVLFFVVDPASGGGVFIVHDLDREAVYMHPFDPDTESLSDYDAARGAQLVRQGLEDPSLALEVENVSSWAMTAQVAERYRAGRILLAGDAAHRFPPTGGLGLNSGVQDAHNLAWKLAAVLGGWAPDRLLDSYETERRPVAQDNADQSLRNAMKLFQVAQALGVTDFTPASAARMEKTLADPEGLARVRAAIESQAEHFDMPGLQLGFRYAEGALAMGEHDAPTPLQVRRFEPSGCPGARVPHVWLGPTPGGESLLDRVPRDRFLLLTGPDGNAWREALERTPTPPVASLVMDAELSPDWARWLEQAGIGPDGALLVRPDQHVAWRHPNAAPQPEEALGRAFAEILAPR